MEEVSAQVRRRYPRRKFRRGVGVLVAGQYMMATGAEIGEGGLSFRVSKPIRNGVLVVLNFQVPEGEFVSVRAEVRNAGTSQNGEILYGCAFENLKFERKREIRTFVTNRSEAEV